MIKMKELLAIATAILLLVMLRSKKLKGDETVYDELIILKSNKYSLDPAMVKATIKVESDFDPQAKNPKDPSYGLMQITPGLAYDYGLLTRTSPLSFNEEVLLFNPSNNIDVGCWNLSRLSKKYQSDVAIQMYNVGETGYLSGKRASSYLNKVKSYIEKYRG